ncbi:DUF11 domain-containing protein, partial [Flavobacterium sp. SUN052]
MQTTTLLKNLNKLKLIFSLFIVLISTSVFAEGTPTLSPNAANITAVLVAPDLASGSYFNAGDDNRIYFNIANAATERMYFGFDWRGYSVGVPARLNNLYYRIKNPSGTVVMSGLWNNVAGSAGSIDTHAQALAGPNIGGVTTGYSPLTFSPTVSGEHWIEFYRSNDGGVTALSTSSDRAVGALFDMTVATTLGIKKNGRVHSDKWGFVAVDSNYGNLVTANSEPNFYVYTADQVVLFVDFRPGFQPIAWNLAVNNYGVNPIGAFNITRKSINTAIVPALSNGYKVFLNNPDPLLYPIASLPVAPTFLNPAISNCGPFSINYNISNPGDVRLVIDLNGVPGYQALSADVILEAYGVPAGNNSFLWDGLNGLGVVVPDGANMTLTLNYLAGRFNLPMYDAELNKNGFNVQSIAPTAISNSQMFWDDSGLTSVGTDCTDANNNTTGTGLNNSLNGTPSPTRAWSGNGNLSNVIPAPAVGANETDGITCNDFGNGRLLNTWGWGLTSASVSTIVYKGCSDLRVVKTVSNATPNVGTNVTFTITASNLGISNEPNAVATDILPTGYTLVSATPSVGTYNNLTGVWAIGAFANGATATLNIIATVNIAGIYSNTATITGVNSDPNLANNTSTSTPVPNPLADLSVIKIVNNSTPNVGSNVTFTITATNNGPSLATGVTVNDAIPTGYTLVSATPSTGTWTSPNWTIGNLGISASTTMTVVATVKATGIYANTATISGSQTDPNPSNNSSTSTPVPVPLADLAVVKVASNMSPIIGTNVTFTITASNNGPSNATGVTVNDAIPAGYTIVSVTPSTGTWTSPNWTIGNLNNGSNATLTIVAKVNPSGSYSNTATINGSQSDPNLSNNTSTSVPVPVNSIIDARDDNGILINGFIGGQSVANVLINDFVNGVPATTSNVILTQISTTNAGVTLNTATGSVNVAPGTPAGTYTLTYQICEVLNPTNCDTAIVTVPVGAASIDAVNDTVAGGNGTTGNPNAGNVLTANGNGPDTLNGTPVTIAQVNLTVVTPAVAIGGAPVPVVNTTTGQISVPAGTPAGTYTITYQICEKLNPTNCDTAVVTITVATPIIDAVNDAGASVIGAAGGQSLANVLVNDTLNGAGATLATVNLTQISTTNAGVTLNTATGSVNVAPGTPSGNYVVTYQICEKLNPTNCDTATVTVTVTNAVIDAVNDTVAGGNGTTGNPNAGNVLTANGNGPDTLNGAAVTIAQVNLTVVTPAIAIGVAPVPVVDTTTGQISVPAGTPAGTYTITYQICEKLNPTNCDTAVVTITVATPIIDAV